MNSTSFRFDYQLNISNASSIEKHLLKCDKLFRPRLSSYVDIREYSEKLFKRGTNFEAWHSGKLVGLVSVYFNDLISRAAFITNVSVESSYQNHGIASTLLSWAIDYGEKLGSLSIKLEVHDSNTKALALYRKFGFEEKYLRSQKIVMIKYI